MERRETRGTKREPKRGSFGGKKKPRWRSTWATSAIGYAASKETGKSGLYLHFKYISSRATKSSSSSPSHPLSSSSSSSNSLIWLLDVPFLLGEELLLFERRETKFNIAMSRCEQATMDIEDKCEDFSDSFYSLFSFWITRAGIRILFVIIAVILSRNDCKRG